MEVFHQLVMNPEIPPASRISAGKEILNRAHGRSPVVIANQDDSANRERILDAIKSAADSARSTMGGSKVEVIPPTPARDRLDMRSFTLGAIIGQELNDD